MCTISTGVHSVFLITHEQPAIPDKEKLKNMLQYELLIFAEMFSQTGQRLKLSRRLIKVTPTPALLKLVQVSTSKPVKCSIFCDYVQIRVFVRLKALSLLSVTVTGRTGFLSWCVLHFPERICRRVRVWSYQWKQKNQALFSILNSFDCKSKLL